MAQREPKNHSLTPRNSGAIRREFAQIFRREQSRHEPSFDGFHDARNSFVPVWISLPPFLMMEYFVELSMPRMPSALVFPVGFLLFWAFYFTFYKPNVLEDKLSDPLRWQLSFPPSLILGLVLWFIKASFLELRYLVLEAPFSRVERLEKTKVVEEKPVVVVREPIATYSPEVSAALRILGIESLNVVTWNEIHRRYRFLAKKLHPDLNRTGTQGRRFIEVDQAYRQLVRQKNLFS
jgi:hypothetical protein